MSMKHTLEFSVLVGDVQSGSSYISSPIRRNERLIVAGIVKRVRLPCCLLCPAEVLLN